MCFSDYINERNMKFNQKLERFYGKYTKEIKDNLERGTAVWRSFSIELCFDISNNTLKYTFYKAFEEKA